MPFPKFAIVQEPDIAAKAITLGEHVAKVERELKIDTTVALPWDTTPTVEVTIPTTRKKVVSPKEKELAPKSKKAVEPKQTTTKTVKKAPAKPVVKNSKNTKAPSKKTSTVKK